MMKKTVLFLLLLIILVLSGCFLFTDFNQTIRLAENALKSGSGSTALEYANEALLAAQNDAEKSKGYMLKGYAYYLLGQYTTASGTFDTSLNLVSDYSAYAGKILTLFMMGNEQLILGYFEKIESIPENWFFELNGQRIEKSTLYNTFAISAKLKDDQIKFEEVRSLINSDLAMKLEAFFE